MCWSRRLGPVLLIWVAALMVLPRPAAADRKRLLSSGSGAGRMSLSADQYGTFGLASFKPAENVRLFFWQYFGSLMLTDGTDYVWLADEDDWGKQDEFGPLGSLLPDTELVSDVVAGAKRTSQFQLSSFGDLVVDLVQELPEAGYNFVQTYTFTNSGTEPMSLRMVLFNDQDHGNPSENRVGFVSGAMPRMYFLEDQDVAGAGDPSVDDRPSRISVITQPGPGLEFDGYLGAWIEPDGALGLSVYIGENLEIPGQDLNTIQEIDGAGAPTGIDLDQDADRLADSAGDVSGALQFSVDLPAKGSTSLGINYVGGSLQNAVFPGAAPPKLQAGDADMDLDFDQLDLVKVQIAAKYLTGQAATWGEGDWNAAPGGSPGNPPPGDRLFNQLDVVAALTAGKYLLGPYAAIAPGGSRGDGQTSIIYDTTTGELAVDAPAGTQLTSINIDSAAGIFAGGQPAQNLGGSFDNDSDKNIFKATFGSSFGSFSFGNVAQAGLSEPLVRSDLTVVGSLAGGGGLGNVDLIYVPEPTAAMLLLLAVLSLLPLYRPCT